MDAFQNLFLRKLLERINADIKERSSNIVAGTASDHADYKAKTSYIQAMHDIVKMCNEVERELMRPEDERRTPSQMRAEMSGGSTPHSTPRRPLYGA